MAASVSDDAIRIQALKVIVTGLLVDRAIARGDDTAAARRENEAFRDQLLEALDFAPISGPADVDQRAVRNRIRDAVVDIFAGALPGTWD